MAILGPSGGGKTTLLSILGGRIKGKYTGSVLLNGKPKTKASNRYLGYVPQASYEQCDKLLKSRV